MPPQIQLEGVRVNNLQNLSLQIPHRALTVVCGLSGSGKSSLAFDTLYAEGQRRYVETFSTSARQFLDRLERPAVDRISGIPPAVAIHQQATTGGPRSTVGTRTEILDALRVIVAAAGSQFCPDCACEITAAGPEAGARTILRNFPTQRLLITVPVTACHAGSLSPQFWLSSGITRAVDNGRAVRLDELSDFLAPDTTLLVIDRLRAEANLRERIEESLATAFALADHCRILAEGSPSAPNEPAGNLQSRPSNSVIIDGMPWTALPLSSLRSCSICGRRFDDLKPETLNFTSPLGACNVCHGTGSAAPVAAAVTRRRAGKTHRNTDSSEQQAISAPDCTACHGSRLNETARAVRWNHQSLTDIARLELAELSDWLQQAIDSLPADLRTALTPAVALIQRRLQIMLDMGLGYLSLDRALNTLSGGEARRTLLAAVLGSGLTGTLYVLDEPTQGLHAQDTSRVLALIRQLRQAGNTLVVVEHDPVVIRAADYVVELGPGAGAAGGRIVFAGHPTELLHADTETAQAIRKSLAPSPHDNTSPRSPQHWLKIRGATCHNLRGLDADIPLGVLCAVTGVSGSGKSSLIADTLVPALQQRLCPLEAPAKPAGSLTALEGLQLLENVLLLDQQPVRRSLRSIPATWLGIWDDIRGLLADTHEARRRNYSRKMFSFNVAGGGRCTACEGRGQITVPMQFLADIDTPCSQCSGTRFLPEVLEIRYRDRSPHEILQMTAEEAFRFFHGQYQIQHRLNAMKQAGLSYLPLGQPLNTLSGGEAQRLRIAAVLAGVPLDHEPTGNARTQPRLTRSGRTLFVLDEPTVGLHPADVQRLIECLGFLLQTGHSVIVIDHDPLLIANADWEIRLGPAAGKAGGQIIHTGPPPNVRRTSTSVPPT